MQPIVAYVGFRDTQTAAGYRKDMYRKHLFVAHPFWSRVFRHLCQLSVFWSQWQRIVTVRVSRPGDAGSAFSKRSLIENGVGLPKTRRISRSRFGFRANPQRDRFAAYALQAWGQLG